MISAWKKLINRVENSNSPALDGNVPPGVQKLDKQIQRKFARGVSYNMKVIIRGDTKVGKTSLFLRLKGQAFDENYTPTASLQVTSIDWNYKATDEVVKIDLWEAVDSTCLKSRNINYVDLKLENQISPASEDDNRDVTNQVKLEAHKAGAVSTTTSSANNIMSNSQHKNPIPESAKQSLIELSGQIDVYKDTNAVLLVMDMTKLWTFKYIQSEFSRIPKDLPVLVIANHQDQGHHRAVGREQIKSFISGLSRGPGDGIVMYTDASMKNGFGLKMIDKFFSIPYLKLQESSLLKQLELNRQDYMTTLEELRLMEDSVDKEYEQYLALQTIRRRQIADSQSPVNQGFKPLDESMREQIRTAIISSETIDKNENLTSIESKDPNALSTAQIMATRNFKNERIPSIVIGASCPLPNSKVIQSPIVEQSKKNDNKGSCVAASANENVRGDGDGGYDEGEEDDDDDDDDDDDEDEKPKANPQVVDYQSDLDPDDQ